MKDSHNIRPAYNAGQWYPSDPNELRAVLKQYLESSIPPREAYGIISPHAGYIYSGATAGKTYSRAIITPTVVVITSSHMPSPENFSLWNDGAWQTPLGPIEVDVALATEIVKAFPKVSLDRSAHLPQATWRGRVADHSLEIQLPFLKYLRKDVRIVPISIVAEELHSLERSGKKPAAAPKAQAELTELKEFGQALALAIKNYGAKVLIVSSSDMNHFLDQQETERRDTLALDQIMAMNPDGLYTVCGENGISMCGAGAAVIMLSAAKDLGAQSVELVEHTTSAAVSRDYNSVVGYAGVIVR